MTEQHSGHSDSLVCWADCGAVAGTWLVAAAIGLRAACSGSTARDWGSVCHDEHGAGESEQGAACVPLVSDEFANDRLSSSERNRMG